MTDFVGELGTPPVRRSDQGINPLARRDEAPAGLPRANASAGIEQPRRGFVPPSQIAPTPAGERSETLRPCPVPSPEPRRLEFANKVMTGREQQANDRQPNDRSPRSLEEDAMLDPVGVIVPMITPLTAAGAIDAQAIDHLVDYLLSGGVSGIFVLGSSGEGPWLRATERAQVVEHARTAANGRAPILAGALQPGSRATLDDVRLLAGAGAEALVITAPYYFAADAATQIRHVEAVAAASPVPVVLYNIPEMTQSPLAATTVGRLAGCANVVAIKDSAGDWPAFAELLALRAARPGFRVLQGAERLSAQAALAGADGLVPGLANLTPQLFTRLFAAAQRGDRTSALAAQAQVDVLWQLHTHGFWLACLKEAAAQLGFGSGATVGHGGRLPAAARAAIAQLLLPYGAEVRA